MAPRFHDKIRFKSVTLRNAQDVAAYNFKCHTSVEYLDLRVNDNLQRPSRPCYKAIFTTESLEKYIIPEREILYKLHLDVPRDLQSVSCKDFKATVQHEAFHLGVVDVHNELYRRDLARKIAQTIHTSQRKIEKLRSFMRIFELLDFGANNDASIFLCDRILLLMYREACTDIELWGKVLALFNFFQWLFSNELPCVLEYVLSQGQIARLACLWQPLGLTNDLITLCFLRNKVRNMRSLIKFGVIEFIPREFNFYTDFIGFNRVVSFLSYPRAFRLFQLLYDFQHHRNYPQGLRYIWRSIKDPFLCIKEFSAILLLVSPPIAVNSAHKYYINHIIDEDKCSFGNTPRTLKDLCRVDVRRLLSYNYQVPHGISSLDIPETLKSYLRLER